MGFRLIISSLSETFAVAKLQMKCLDTRDYHCFIGFPIVSDFIENLPLLHERRTGSIFRTSDKSDCIVRILLDVPYVGAVVSPSKHKR